MTTDTLEALFVLESTLRVCHWITEGSDFVDFHENLGEWYDQVGEYIDELVEAVIGLGLEVDLTAVQHLATGYVEENVVEALGDNSEPELMFVVMDSLDGLVDLISTDEDEPSVEVIYDEILRWANHVRYIIRQSRR